MGKKFQGIFPALTTPFEGEDIAVPRFRENIARFNQLGLTGWVRNCWDETVEMEVQGDEETITEMIKRIRTSSYIEITDAKWTKIPLESEFGFHIR